MYKMGIGIIGVVIIIVLAVGVSGYLYFSDNILFSSESSSLDKEPIESSSLSRAEILCTNSLEKILRGTSPTRKDIANIQKCSDEEIGRYTQAQELSSGSCVDSMASDIDDDGAVGVKDLLMLLGSWGPCDDPENCPADLDGNGIIGVSDLLILLANWGPVQECECNDSIDNDKDGWIDYPNDPQCDSAEDEDESVDFVRLDKSSNRLNLGDALNGPFGSTVDDEDLLEALADGVYTTNDGEETDTEQMIRLGSPELAHFRDSDYEYQQGFDDRTPTIGFELESQDFIFNYTLNFLEQPISEIINGSLINFEDTEITILGDVYRIEEAILNDTLNGILQLVLVNEDGSQIITLFDGYEIMKNGYSINRFRAYFDSTINGSILSLDKIILEWKVDDELFITDLSFIELPAFEPLRFYMNGFFTPAQEKLEVLPDGESSIKLKAQIIDGLADFNFLYANASGELIGIGKDENERLVTSNTNSLTFNITRGDKWFVASSWIVGEIVESYLLTINSRDIQNNSLVNTVTIRNAVTREIECDSKEVGDVCNIGNVELTVEEIVIDGENKWATFSINSGSSFDELYTTEGLHVQLPYLTTQNDSLPGALNLQGNMQGHNADSFHLFFTEEDKDEDIAEGVSFSMTISETSYDDGKIHVWLINGAGNGGPNGLELNNTGIYETYIVSDLATRILHFTEPNPNQDWAELFYHGAESFANVYLHAHSTRCSNELDDDFDGLIDGNDPQCDDGWDDSED